MVDYFCPYRTQRRRSPGKRPAKDEDVDILCHRADETAELEEGDGDEEDGLGAHNGKHLAVEEEERGLGEEECRGYPADVVAEQRTSSRLPFA